MVVIDVRKVIIVQLGLKKRKNVPLDPMLLWKECLSVWDVQQG
jgi:hypothetical protein